MGDRVKNYTKGALVGGLCVCERVMYHDGVVHVTADKTVLSIMVMGGFLLYEGNVM